MAVATKVITPEHYYKYKTTFSGAYIDHYYMDMPEDSIRIYEYRDAGTGHAMCVSLPDLKSFFGRHVIYSIEVTFRAVFSPDLYIPEVQFPNTQLPNEGSVPEYIIAPYPMAYGIGEVLHITQHTDADLTLSDIIGADGSARITSNSACSFLEKRAAVIGYGTNHSYTVYKNLINGNPLKFTVYYDDTEFVPRYVSSVSGVTSGYMNPRRVNTIGWKLDFTPDAMYSCVDKTLNPVHETLYWRVSDASTWNSISIPDYSSSYDIPASTFPTNSDIEWYLSIVDEDAITSNSSVFTITTTDGTSVAEPVSPVNTIEIGNQPITFSWSASNETGEEPSGARAFWAAAETPEDWTELFDVNETIYRYDVPAGTFPGGNIYWKIQTYNADGVAGPESEPVIFSCASAPPPPNGIVGDGAPFTTLSWQSQNQIAYEIKIDGELVTKKYGPGIYTYRLTEPLSDGEHSVSIRVQGAYGFWSDPGETIITVTNNGTGTIDLTGRFDVDGTLFWTYTNIEEDKTYRIYRDGILIARTNEESFYDRFALGKHIYHVLAELPGGNYCRSNDLPGTMRSTPARIAPVNGGAWICLHLSENSARTQTYEWTRSVTLRHYAGAAYPVAELSPFENRSGDYDCAFKSAEDAKAFEALKGKTVILKSNGDEVNIGVLSAISKTVGTFYLSYHFVLQKSHWEEFIDDTVG